MPQASASQRDLATAARHLSSLVAQGQSFDDALGHLRKNSRPALQRGADNLENLVKQPNIGGEFPRLASLCLAAQENGGDAQTLIENWGSMTTPVSQKVDELMGRTRSAVVRTIALFAFSAIMLVAFAYVLLPQFASMFNTFDAALPGATAFVINVGGLLGIVILVALVLKTFWLSALNKQLQPALMQLAFIGGAAVRLPLLSTLADSYNQLAALTHARVLSQAKLSSEEAVMAAVTSASGLTEWQRGLHDPQAVSNQPVLDGVLAAQQLDTLDTELDIQAGLALNRLEEGIDTFEGRIKALSIIFTGATVVLLLVAAYTPIFAIGNVV